MKKEKQKKLVVYLETIDELLVINNDNILPPETEDCTLSYYSEFTGELIPLMDVYYIGEL